jgi:flagellar hook-length control protein FliK
MALPILPTPPASPTGTARGAAAGRVCAAAGDFTAELDALLAATGDGASGLAALLAAVASGGAASLPPDAAAAPPPGTPAGATPSFPTFPAATPAFATSSGTTPSLAMPAAPSPLATAAAEVPTAPPFVTGDPVPAPPTATGADPTGARGPQPGSERSAPPPSPTGEADPTGTLRPGAGAGPGPANAVPGLRAEHPSATPGAPINGELPPAADPRPRAEAAPRPTEPQGPAPITGPSPAPVNTASAFGLRPSETAVDPEAAAPAAIPARIAELTRRRTGSVEQIVVRLDPPELGAVRITVTARGDHVHLTLRADTPEARAALAAQRESIETLLSSEGFNLGSFDVGHQARRDGRHDNGRRSGGPRFADAFEPTEPAHPAPAAADGALRL